MSNIFESRTKLSFEEKRALLARLLQEEISHTNTFPPSFAQQRLWFLHQLESDSPVYNVSVAVRLTGPLNVAALKKSLNEIVQRHEVLRTTFEAIEEQPLQIVSPTLSLSLPLVNLQTWPESKREAEAQRLAREEVRRPFDLSQGPLLRATLLQLAEEEHLLLLVVHHIVFDAWSRGILLQELFTLYKAFAGGEPSPLPELPVQYVDFAQWQRQWVQGELMESQLAYWQQQLAEAPPVLELPTDRPRPPSQTYRGSVERFQLDADLVQKLKTWGQQSGATLFMTLLAGFVALLARYSGQKDIVVGSPIAARNRAEIEPLIGFFVNTLVFRTDLSGDPTGMVLLERVRQVALGAYAHQDIPFEQLVDALQPERSLSYAPLFQVMFAFQNVPDTAITELESLGLTLSQTPVETGTAKFDLSLSLAQDGAGIVGALEYNTDLFEAATVARMVGHWQTLLAGMVANPQQPLSKLPLLTAAEQQQLLVEWNDTGVEYSQGQCLHLHTFFEAQVEHTPEALAVIFENERLTYRELNRRANQLAHYLQGVGVGPEVPVGVWLERSPEAIVALLGIFKAGGVYVPFDPTYPRERLAFMLEDAQIPVLLTRQSLIDTLPPHNARVICLDSDRACLDDRGTIEQANAENPDPGVMVDHLAYIIYTSGSTGRPKGVLVTHRGLCNLVQAQIRAFELEPGRRVLQFAPFNFDASISEIFTTLLSGATLCLARQDDLLPDQTLAALLRDLEITTITLPPSALAVLPATEFPALQTIISAGEECSADIVARWAPGRTFLNAYGPTEATVCATFAVCTDASRKPPIGRPIDNTQVYILDAHLQPVPIGVPGELYLAGVGLARGYLNRPGLTAEKFIPNPFLKDEGGRMKDEIFFHPSSLILYKTGDLARYLSDGNIEFLGRLDQQVKIRGFRIELAGIEAVLAEHPLVQEAVVTVQEIEPVAGRQAAPGDKRLVAYYVTSQESEPTQTELRHFLQQKLPDYMIPAAFMRLEAIPLLPNGKVNRRALPVPDTNRPELAQTYIAPRNPAEETLADIWAGVLGLDHVGIHDNFFELGGHSLQAVQLVSKVSTALERNLSVKLIFSHPTIAALANTLGSLPSSNDQAVPKVTHAKPAASDRSAASPPTPSSPPASSLLKIEGNPLLSLLATGKIEPVDAASLGYLTRADYTRADVIRDWFDNLPVCTRIIETGLGRVAVLLLPRFDTELYVDEKDLVNVIIEALKMAKHLGASTVSLTGLIPSATDYGQAITAAVTDQPDLPAISTGHATTTATVGMTIEKTLAESGRDLTQECVGVLGLGSIGTSSLRLMLKSLPHPPEIILCDLYRNLDVLEKIKRELVADLEFQGTVRLAKSQTQTEVPPEFYEASLMIGATNVPDVLDITRVKSGTMIVDDSGPHCFEAERAIQRFEEKQDILFTEGGVLKSPQPISELRYVPKEAAQNPNLAELQVVLSRGLRRHPFNITACTFSSLLSACFEELKPTVGLVEVGTSLQHYHKLKQLGFQAADLHCRDYTLAEEGIRDFRRRFGK